MGTETDEEVGRLLSEAAEEARRALRPYPELGEDIRRARENFTITPFDLALLSRVQDELCAKCGECCRRCTPINVSYEEAEMLAWAVDIPSREFKRRFGLRPREDGSYDIPGAPCPFLKGSLCSVYSVRPLVCRAFPASVPMADMAAGDPRMRLPGYCRAVKEFFVLILVREVLRSKIEREDPSVSEKIRELESLLARSRPKTSLEALQRSFRLLDELGVWGERR
jgi:Fe-S-cluster containining protein